jgi:hypothetical protein
MMKLHFPNPSRSFDASSNRILFWGYDSTIEVSFFLEAAVLKQLYPDLDNAETDLLKAFDAAREIIYKVADSVYRHGGGGKGTYAYVLAVEDF